MKKILFLAAFLLNAGAASAAQFKVTCCDGTVVYCQGLSLKVFEGSGAAQWEIDYYKNSIGEFECKNRGGCALKIEELPLSLSIVEKNETGIQQKEMKEEATKKAPSQA